LIAAKTPEPVPLVPLQAVWTLALNSHITVRPTYDATRAYFAIEENRIAAYEVQSGTRLWLESARAVLPGAATDNLLILAEADALVALRAVDGTVAWRVPIDSPLSAAPAAVPGFIVVADEAGAVAARHVSDGSVLWQRDIGSPARATAAIAAGRVY